MDRREFLALTLSAILLDGCGGGGKEIRTVSSEPRTVRINLNREQVGVVSVPVGSSLLDILKTAFPYEREAPLENADSFTTIGGISGHWRYEVDSVEPLVNIRDYPVQSDCSVELMLF